jgi:hypothetical protein
MKKHWFGILALAGLVVWGATATSQQPRGGDRPEKKDGPGDRKDGQPRFMIGKVLPPFVVDELNLTADQKDAIAKLEKEVQERLDKILTADQKKKLETIRPPRGPGGPADGKDRPEKGDRPERGQRPPLPEE